MHNLEKKFEKEFLVKILFLSIVALVFSVSFASSAFAAFNATAAVWNNASTDFNRTTLTGLTSETFSFGVNNTGSPVASPNAILGVNITNATSGSSGYVVIYVNAPDDWTCTITATNTYCTHATGIAAGSSAIFNLTVKTPLAGSNNASRWVVNLTDDAATPVSSLFNLYTLALGTGDIGFDMRDQLGNVLYNANATLYSPSGDLTLCSGNATLRDDGSGVNDTYVDGLVLFRRGTCGVSAQISASTTGTYSSNSSSVGYVNVTASGTSYDASKINVNIPLLPYTFKITTLNDELNYAIAQSASDGVTTFSSTGASATPVNLTFAGNWYIALTDGSYIIQYFTPGFIKQNTSSMTASSSGQVSVDYTQAAGGESLGLKYALRVIGFDEIGRNLLMNGNEVTGVVVNASPKSTFRVLRYNASGNTVINATYIALNGSANITIKKAGFVNVTNASILAPPSGYNTQTTLQFGNGTLGNGTVQMCDVSTTCAGNLTFTVKILAKNEFGNTITGAKVWINTTKDQAGSIYAVDGGANDTDEQANGVIYWALSTSGAGTGAGWKINVTRDGYLEWNSTVFTLSNATQFSNTSYNNFTLIMQTFDEYQNILYSPSATANVTDIGNDTTSCQKNSTFTNLWGCPFQAGLDPSPTIYVNTSMSSGHMNFTRVYAPIPAAFYATQFTNTSYNNFTLLVTTNDEFNQNIYGASGVNVTGVETASGLVICVQNTTRTYSWGCPLTAGSSATAIFANVSGTSGYLNYTIQSATPAANNGILGSQGSATSYNKFTVLLTGQDEFGLPIYESATTNITNVSTSSIKCNKNATNTYNYGCRIAGGTTPIVYINVTNSSGFMNATNASIFTAPGTAGPQNVIFSNNKYTVLLTTRDEFNNLIYSPNGANTNITDVIFNHTAATIYSCAKNSTNTSVWGCPVPVSVQAFGNNVTFNVSATSGYLNYTYFGYGSAASTEPSLQILNASLNRFSIRITTRDEFNNLIYSFSGSITNVTKVYGNVTEGVPVYCNQNATDISVWGCRFMPGLTSTTVFVNTSGSSGYLNYSFNVTPAALTANTTQTLNTSFNTFRVLLRTVDEFGVVIYNATATTFLPNITNVYISTPTTINCVQNVTGGSYWGCPFNVSNPKIFVNASSTSGFLNGTNATVFTTPLTSDTQASVTSNNKYSVLVYTTNNFGLPLTGTSNVTRVHYNPGSVRVNCTQNVTNTAYWGCRANVTTDQATLFVNMSTSSGYLNYSSLIFDNYAANIQNLTTTMIQYGVNVTTTDQLGNMLTNVFGVVAYGTAGESPEAYLLCDKNATNTSVWGCAIPNATTRTAVVNVSMFGYVNSSTTGVLVPQGDLAPTAVVSANQFTLRVGLKDGTVDPQQNMNATVNVLRDANTRTLFSYTSYNDTNGIYYFPVNATNSSAINVTVTKVGYQSQSVKDNRVISAAAQQKFNITLTQVNSSDLTGPSISVTTPSNTSNASSTTPTITFIVTDDNQIDLSSISVSGVSGFSAAQNCTGNIQRYTCSFATTALTDGTNYTVTFNARDASGNTATQQTLYFGYSSNTIIITTLISSTSSGVADNTYTDGLSFKFNITLGTSGNATRFRMNDWCLVGSDCSGNNKIAVSGNVIMNYTTLNGTTMMYNVKNAYNETEAVTPLFDIDATSGIQGNVTIYVKIPTGTNSGSYSTTFAAGLYSVATTGG